ncbi:arginine N-succinyltransferase [Sinimarinibacterium thermocellulolyticum]|uniref:Arginine N-succinyltransferase n=1 Tax=Sinimarinibacterium thermocellulolyticum TaxID=3170016 RepID=A0ABV2A9B1_9GAMM
MRYIRPIQADDLDALLQMARTAGAGFTSLPPDRDTLRAKIERSLRSFAEPVNEPGHQRYMFVLVESETGEVGGCCAVEAACGLDEPFYNYHVGLTVHASRTLNVYTRVPTLYLSNDLTGSSVLCSLYLAPAFRAAGMGHLLSKSRFLFIASHRARFADKIIAEMRGVSDAAGRSPFWEGLGRHFFSIEYELAEHIVGQGNKACIAELMPTHPIYTSLLPAEAQRVMGRVHEQTAPALKLLEQEGFRYQNYIDIFDGGPTVEAPTAQVRSIRRSRVLRVRVGDGTTKARATPHLISNLSLGGFRCALAPLSVQQDRLSLTPALAATLGLADGDNARVVAL